MHDAAIAIKKGIEEGSCIVFLGSGVPAEAGLFNASELCEILLKDLPSEYAGTDLRSVSQAYANIYSNIDLKKRIQDELERRMEESPLDLSTYKLIGQLPGVHFITTNWDTLLESNFKPTQMRVVFRPDEVVFWDSRRQNILKMHGCIKSPSTMLVTRREYDEYHDKCSEFVRKVSDLLRENTLIICGYSLEDSTFRDIFLRVQGEDRKPPHNVFWVDPYVSGGYIDDWRAYGIKHVDATARDFFRYLNRFLAGSISFPDTNGYNSLSQIALRILEIGRSFSVLETLEISDSEFFNEKIMTLMVMVGEYIGAARREVDRLSRSHLLRVIDISTQIRKLPEDLDVLFDENHSRILIGNPDSARIRLRALAERYDSALEELCTACGQRMLFLEGKPFPEATQVTSFETFNETVQRFISSVGIKRYSSLLSLLRNHRAELRNYLELTPLGEDQKSQLLQELWGSFDVVLLEEEPKIRGERILKSVLDSDDGNVKKMLFVLGLLERYSGGGQEIDSKKVEADLKSRSYSAHDRRVVLRCLTCHKYSHDIRCYAVDNLDLNSLWVLLSSELFPIASVYEAGRRIFREGNSSYEKILFDLAFEDIQGKFASSVSGSDLSMLEQFLLLFESSRIMLEDSYCQRYIKIIDQSHRGAGINSDNFLGLVRARWAGDRELTKAAQPEEASFHAIPSVARKKLAKNVFYFLQIIRSKRDEIALEVLEWGLTSYQAAEIFKARTANTKLLDKIVGDPKLLSTYEAKREFLFNRAAHASHMATAEWCLPSLGDHDLLRLSESSSVDINLKRKAEHLVAQRQIRTKLDKNKPSGRKK